MKDPMDISPEALKELRQFIEDSKWFDHQEYNDNLTELMWLGHSGRLLALITEVEELRKENTSLKSQVERYRRERWTLY